MASDGIPLRIGLLIFAAFAITILFVIACTTIWKHNFLEGSVFLGCGLILGYVFFRKRIVALAVVVFSTIFALAGMGVISYPSATGIALTAASAAGAYLLVVWDSKKHPERALADWKTIFDNETKR